MNVDPVLILQICNYIFYGIIGIVAIKGIIGIFKGFWKALCAFIVSLICYVLIVIFNSDIAGALYNMDLTGMVEGTSITFNGVNIDITTLGELIKEMIIVMAGESIDLASNPELLDLAATFALTIISYISFIVLVIVTIFVVSPLLSLLIYHILFKFIIGKENREKRKLRFLGFLTNAVKAFVSTCLLITPFSALTNSVSDAVSAYDFDYNETSLNLKELVNAYDESLLAKTLNVFSINGTSFDVAVTDYATGFDLGEEGYTSFIKELSDVLDIAAAGIEEGVIDLETGVINTQGLLSKVFISKTLETLAGNPLITKLLPVVVSIVVNMDSIKNIVDITEVDWNGIDWSNELSTLDDIYGQFYELDIMDVLINGEDINSYTLDRKDQRGFEQIFENIGSSEVLQAVLPPLLSSFAGKLEGEFAGILPTDVSYYENIDLGNELSAIYDSVLTLSDLARYSPLGRNVMIGDISNQDILTSIVNFIIGEDGVNGYRIVDIEGTPTKEYFYSTDSIASTGNEPLPISANSFFSGVNKTEQVREFRRQTSKVVSVHKGLLDSTLLLDNMGALLKAGLRVAQFTEYDLEPEIDAFASEVDTKEEWSAEVDDLLHVVSIVNNNPNLPLDSIDITNKTQIEELKRLTPYIDDSKLIKLLFPKLFKGLMGDKELIFGLTVNDLGLECDNLGSEIANLMDLVSEASDIMNLMSGENAVSNLLNKDKFQVSTLNNILDTVYSSKLLNPIPEEGNNSNFATLLKGIFDNESLTNAGFKIDSNIIDQIDNEDLIYRKSKSKSVSPWMIEVNTIINIFATLQDADSMKGFITGEGETPSISSIDGDEVEDLIIALADSRLIEPNIGTMFNKYLGESLKSMNLSLDFEMVTDWENEARNLNAVLHSIQNISSNISFENLDISKLNYVNADGTTGVDDLHSIIDSIYHLSSMRDEVSSEGNIEQVNERFADFIYKTITSSVFSTFIDDSNKLDVEMDHYFEIDKEIYLNQTNPVYVSWDQPSNSVDYKGEISNIIDLVRYIVTSTDSSGNSLFFNEDGQIVLDAALKDSSILSSLTEKVNNISPFRTILSSLLDNQISNNANIQMDGIDLSKINSEVFTKSYNYRYKGNDVDYISASRYQEIKDRQVEIDLLCEVMGEIEDITSVINGNSSDITAFRPIVESGANSSSILENLLTTLHDSKLFNTNKVGEENLTTLFEDIVKLVLDKASISSMLYDADYDSVSQDEKVYSIIEVISSKDIEGVEWISEIEKFNDLLWSIVSIDGLTSLDNITSLPEGNLVTILTKINESYLTHDVLANQVNKIFSQVNLDDYLLTGTPKIDAHYIDELDISYQEKVSMWNNDIVHLVDLYDVIGDGFDSLIIDDGSGHKTVKAGLFEDILPSLGQIKTLTHQRADILYSIFDKASISTYISEFKYSVNSSSELKKRDLISYLIQTHVSSSDALIEDASWHREGKYLDILINSLLEHKDANFDFEDGVNHVTSAQVFDIYHSTYTYTKDESIIVDVSSFNAKEALEKYESQYERGYLSSEIISSFMEKMLNDLGQGDIVLPNFRTDYYYYGLNEIEMNGLSGLLDLTQGLLDYNAAYNNNNYFNGFDYHSWEVGMIKALDMMGTSQLDPERIVYLNIDSSNRNTYGYDSIIAERLYDYLIGKNHATIDEIESSTKAGLDIFNYSYGGSYTEEHVSINWDLKAFEIKKDEWFNESQPHRPFENLELIVLTINNVSHE